MGWAEVSKVLKFESHVGRTKDLKTQTQLWGALSVSCSDAKSPVFFDLKCAIDLTEVIADLANVEGPDRYSKTPSIQGLKCSKNSKTLKQNGKSHACQTRCDKCVICFSHISVHVCVCVVFLRPSQVGDYRLRLNRRATRAGESWRTPVSRRGRVGRVGRISGLVVVLVAVLVFVALWRFGNSNESQRQIQFLDLRQHKAMHHRQVLSFHVLSRKLQAKSPITSKGRPHQESTTRLHIQSVCQAIVCGRVLQDMNMFIGSCQNMWKERDAIDLGIAAWHPSCTRPASWFRNHQSFKKLSKNLRQVVLFNKPLKLLTSLVLCSLIFCEWGQCGIQSPSDLIQKIEIQLLTVCKAGSKIHKLCCLKWIQVVSS